MLTLVSTSAIASPSDLIRVAVPIGVGIASAAYLTMKAMNKYDSSNADMPIPTVRIRPGDTSNDAEYDEDNDLFLARCEEEYGLVFNCSMKNQYLTVISGSLVREIFMTEELNFMDAVDEINGFRTFETSVLKSKHGPDSREIHEIVRDDITPFLPMFIPRIMEQLTTIVDDQLGHCENKLIEKPLGIFQDMVAGAMANVFMGPKIAKDPKVIDSFIQCTYDFAEVVGKDNNKKFWRRFKIRTKYGYMNPLQKHVRILTDAAAPVVLERRREETEAAENGVEYVRPLDILQRLLDNFDKYGFVDLEDICGHLLILVIASVHTTSDSSSNMCYYLAAFPECIDTLYHEQQQVLDQIEKERQASRQKKLESGEVVTEQGFEDTELDPKNDRDLSTSAIKRMVYMDSFIREILRCRTERLSLAHLARSDVKLSNGMVIPKGRQVHVNIRSVHQGFDNQDEDPTEFRPWRFVGKPKSATKISKDFLRFGMGRHACPGRFLAILEMKAIGSVIVSKYSKIEIQDRSKTKKALFCELGIPADTGLIFTSRH
ncbi:hypothetical protein BGZ80_004325 [Entomortierella chlamydospora]|uniref:Cytochrome p450 n=1 Tax=Entomortierella chlamydospora TaxID=101097 RepID=A0A9P6SW39_9FUNG|nr:hypothetical protein BGZ79_010177 [Entomortierella chlamydospora]KAG0007718.1 hypothetical protein BGZ80_004325 [Entomortierella chlamydospora]